MQINICMYEIEIEIMMMMMTNDLYPFEEWRHALTVTFLLFFTWLETTFLFLVF